MLKNSKFNIIYEEVLTKSLNIQDFQYKFSFDTSENILSCKFESIDKVSNKLIFIQALLNQKTKQLEFKVHFENQENEKTYTSKEFLLAYYKEYHNFKMALKVYKDDPDFFIDKKEENEQNNDEVPKIESLDEVLQQDDQQNNGIVIKKDGINFTFKSLNESNINDLVSCTFNIKNSSNVKSSEDLEEYIAVSTIKISDFNSKILSVDLFDPKEFNSQAQAIKKLTTQDFKHKFKDIYFSLLNALSFYQKRYKNQSIKNI